MDQRSGVKWIIKINQYEFPKKNQIIKTIIPEGQRRSAITVNVGVIRITQVRVSQRVSSTSSLARTSLLQEQK